MFDSLVVGELDLMSGSELAAAISGNHAELLARGCRVLELACAWADLHYQEVIGGEYSPLVERACFYGGPGTPPIGEFCVAEFGALQGTGSMAAQMLIADALDLRWRLPRLWAQVKAGQVRAWQARRVAEQTRPLSWPACADLDGQLSGIIGMVSWGRFQRILTAAILDADPELAQERAERARRLRDVWATDSDDGLKTVIARAAAGDAVWFMAIINRIADILGTQGDGDPVAVRRSKAIGVLAHPAHALALLAAHRDDPAVESEPDPTVESEPDPTDRPGSDDADAPATETDDHVSQPAGRPAGRELTAAEVRAVRPRVVLHFHLCDAAVRAGHGVARPEHGEPASLAELRDWLAGTGCSVTVKPVFQPADQAPGRCL